MKQSLRARWEQSALKAWAEGKLRLSRGKKLAVNLAVILVVCLWLWGLAGYPLPTAEMEFRRLERQALLPRSQIVFATPEFQRSTLAISGHHRTVTALDGTELTLNGRWLVGVTEGRATVALVGWSGRDRSIWTIPLRENGPTLLPLDGMARGYWVEEGSMPGGYRYDYRNFVPLLVLNAPEGAARLEAAVTDEAGDVWEGLGWDLGNGVWMLAVECPQDSFFGDWYQGCAYTLRLYGGDGALLEEQEGTVPKAA